jgi:hypothetical protein
MAKKRIAVNRIRKQDEIREQDASREERKEPEAL